MWKQSMRRSLSPGVLGLTLALLFGCAHPGRAVVGIRDQDAHRPATPLDATPPTASPVPSNYVIRAPLDVEPLPLEYPARRDEDGHAKFPDPPAETFYKWARGSPYFYQVYIPEVSTVRTKHIIQPPPLEYLTVGDGNVAPGWRDGEVFYMWRGIELPMDKVPAGQRERVHDPQWQPRIVPIKISSIDITAFGVSYGVRAGTVLVLPGYYDWEADVFYAWRDAALSPDEAPAHASFNGRLFMRILPNTRVVPITPPVDYVLLDKGRVAPGWYADPPGTFFQWRGIEMNLKDLPASARARVHDGNWPADVTLVTRKSWTK